MPFERYADSLRRPKARVDDAEFRRRCDEAKNRVDLSEIIGRHTKLNKRGAREMKGLCPFHQERTPSFEVNDAKGRYHCHGCGVSGDHFTFLTKYEHMTFVQAYEALTNETFPKVDEAEKVRRAIEDEAIRAAAIEEARTFWAGAVDIYGSPAEAYLRQARGITSNLPPSLRFGMVPSRKDDDGNWGRTYPALIGAVTRGDDLVAIQRIFLRDDGTDKRWGKKSKLTLGRYRGGAIKMGRRLPDPFEIIVTEGPEDALSLAQGLPDQEVWSALGTANMALLQFPQSVRCVVIAGQNDGPGRAAVEQAGLALHDRGLIVRTMWPDARFKDWNDQLRGIAR